ncbi:MAG: L,D-transpeptidase family protein [Kiritimatiellia bacterium]
MTDIYIHQSASKKKRVLAVILLGMSALAVVVWNRSQLSPKNDPQPLTEPEISSAGPRPGSSTVASPGKESLSPREFTKRLSEIKEAIANGNLLSARESALSLLDETGNHPSRGEVETLLGDLHTRLVFSAAEMPGKTLHVVRGGDTLGELARTYSTTTDLIAEANGIRNNMIRAGAALKILNGEFSAVVSKSRNDLELRLNDRFFKRYRVGTGTDSSTPAGDYVITLRMRHPVWYRTDGRSFPYGHPENLLGTHYLKLNTPGIGLHGTWEPESVGSQSSAGCVRLENEMIEELYKLLPEGTSVRITD